MGWSTLYFAYLYFPFQKDVNVFEKPSIRLVMRKIRSPCRLATDSTTHTHQMSPRAFQTIIVASMGSKDRLELESKVLAAALKQSHARGDSSGVSLAHKQIFLLLRQQQTAEKLEGERKSEPASRDEDRNEKRGENRDQDRAQSAEPELESSVEVNSEESGIKRKRVMPDIVWTAEDESSGSSAFEETQSSSDSQDNAIAASADVEAGKTGEGSSSSDDGEIDFSASGDYSVAGEYVTTADSRESADSDGGKPNFNAYGILRVDQIASFEEIHRSFLFHVRRILFALKKAKRKQRKPLLEELQNLWIAHDILSDPVTRTDFDFRVLGLRGAPDVLIHSAPEDKSDSISSRTPLRIGELMQCAGLLEPTELEIAADMHKAMPEMLFGAFLVKQGFISEEDLGQVLTGQLLLKNGTMTVGHYQICMKTWRETRVPIEETAVAEGLVTQQEMDRVIASGQRDTVTGAPAYHNSVSLRHSAPQINQEEAAKRKFSAGHAVPLWKDQLDWSEPEAIQAYVEEEPDFEHRKPVESSLDIEGITDSVSTKDGKKSLRRLMEGIHTTPDTNVTDDSGVHKSLKNIFGDSGPQSPAGAERLAASTADKPSEVSVAVDSVAAEQELKGAQEDTLSAQLDTSSELPVFKAIESVPPEPKRTEDIRTSEALKDAVSKAEPHVALPTSEVPLPKIVMEERNRLPAEPDEENVFGEVDYDDDDEAVGDMDLSYSMDELPAPVGSDSGQNIAPYGMTPSSVTETASIESPAEDSANADDLLDFSTSSDSQPPSSEIRKVLDEAFHGVRTSETEIVVVIKEPEADSQTSIDSSLEALGEDDESEMESGVYPQVYGNDSIQETVSDAVSRAESIVAQANEQQSSTAGEPQEIRLSSIILESIEKDEADEITGETEVAAAKSSLPTGEIEQPVVGEPQTAEPAFSQDDAEADSGHSRATMSMEVPPITARGEAAEPVDQDQVDQTVTRGLESVTGDVSIVVREGDASEPSPDADATSDGDATVEVEHDAPSSLADGEDTNMDEATIEISIADGITQVEQSTIGMTSGGADQEDKTASNPQDEQSSASDTENPPIVKLTDVSGSIPGIAPLEETPSRLKSGEWQIVYKLEGSIADAFLSEEGEQEMPKLRPRLTEIDSVIPSSITKLVKGDDEDAEGADKPLSDAPVIKPVSMNYNRDKNKNEKGKGKGGDKGNKGKKDS